MTPAAQTSEPRTDNDFEEMLAGFDRIIHDKELQRQLLDAGLLVRTEGAAAAALPAAPAPELPAQALDWARQLVEQGYRDEHIVTFTEMGYGLEHPIRCRPNLIGCQFNEWLATQIGPDREPGRYVMTWGKNGPRYTAYAEVPEPQGSGHEGAQE